MERRDAEALDRHITGNYGEDQFESTWDEDYVPECQVSNCDEDAEDGVLCTKHQEQIPSEATMMPEEDDDATMR